MTSTIKMTEKIDKEAIIKNVLITIPNKTENKMRFFLYSFFKGLKYVAKRPGKENNLRQ